MKTPPPSIVSSASQKVIIGLSCCAFVAKSRAVSIGIALVGLFEKAVKSYRVRNMEQSVFLHQVWIRIMEQSVFLHQVWTLKRKKGGEQIEDENEDKKQANKNDNEEETE